MDKRKLVDALREMLESELAVQMESERATREAATHEESKPENQYDTRALENSYLAGAQSKRITEMEELLTIYRLTTIKDFGHDDPIANTALVEVMFKGRTQTFLMMPKGGGSQITFDGVKVQVITPSSPVGAALVGLKVDETAFIENGGQVLEYEVLSVR